MSEILSFICILSYNVQCVLLFWYFLGLFDLYPPLCQLSPCIFSGILQLKRKSFICQLAVTGCNALVERAHCQQIIHHTPTGMAEHLGVRELTSYLVRVSVTQHERVIKQECQFHSPKENTANMYLLGLLQVEQSNVSRLFIAGDDVLLPVCCAPIGRWRPGVLIGQRWRGSWDLL